MTDATIPTRPRLIEIEAVVIRRDGTREPAFHWKADQEKPQDGLVQRVQVAITRLLKPR